MTQFQSDFIHQLMKSYHNCRSLAYPSFAYQYFVLYSPIVAHKFPIIILGRFNSPARRPTRVATFTQLIQFVNIQSKLSFINAAYSSACKSSSLLQRCQIYTKEFLMTFLIIQFNSTINVQFFHFFN